MKKLACSPSTLMLFMSLKLVCYKHKVGSRGVGVLELSSRRDVHHKGVIRIGERKGT